MTYDLRARERDLARELRALRKKIRAASKKRTPSAKDRARAEHKASTGTLREQVAERAAGKSEISGSELGAAWEMHHVEGGGLRRSKQRPGNVLAITWDEHRALHRGDLDTLRRVALAPTLDADARRAAQRRVDKVLEARGVAVRLEVA